MSPQSQSGVFKRQSPLSEMLNASRVQSGSNTSSAVPSDNLTFGFPPASDFTMTGALVPANPDQTLFASHSSTMFVADSTHESDNQNQAGYRQYAESANVFGNSQVVGVEDRLGIYGYGQPDANVQQAGAYEAGDHSWVSTGHFLGYGSFDNAGPLSWDNDTIDPNLQAIEDCIRNANLPLGALTESTQNCMDPNYLIESETSMGNSPQQPLSSLDDIPFSGNNYTHSDQNIHQHAMIPIDNHPSSHLADNDQTQMPSDGPVQPNSGYKALIADEGAFRMAQLARRQRLVQQPSDFPLDAAGQQAYIKELYDAIKNTDQVWDSQKVIDSFVNDPPPDGEIEMLCWELLLAARDSQEFGRLVAPYYGYKHEEYASFSQRIGDVIHACKYSKAICKSLLAPRFSERLADGPAFELKRKENNKKLNTKKTGQNKAGQEAIKRRQADENGQWRGEGLQGVLQQPTPAEGSENHHGVLEQSAPVEEDEDGEGQHVAKRPRRRPRGSRS